MQLKICIIQPLYSAGYADSERFFQWEPEGRRLLRNTIYAFNRDVALEMMTRFYACNTGAWVVRSSVSMGEDSPEGGGSVVVSPDGTVPADMGIDVILSNNCLRIAG